MPYFHLLKKKKTTLNFNEHFVECRKQEDTESFVLIGIMNNSIMIINNRIRNWNANKKIFLMNLLRAREASSSPLLAELEEVVERWFSSQKNLKVRISLQRIKRSYQIIRVPNSLKGKRKAWYPAAQRIIKSFHVVRVWYPVSKSIKSPWYPASQSIRNPWYPGAKES